MQIYAYLTQEERYHIEALWREGRFGKVRLLTNEPGTHQESKSRLRPAR